MLTKTKELFLICYSFLEKLFPHVIESHPGLVVYYLELVQPFGKHRYLPCRKKLYDILMYVYDANKEEVRSLAQVMLVQGLADEDSGTSKVIP